MNRLERLFRHYREKLGLLNQPSTRGAGSGRITNLNQLPSVWTAKHDAQWLIENLIAEQSVTLLTAESGTGKTWLAYALAGAVAHGTPFIGNSALQRRVIYLDGENPLAARGRNSLFGKVGTGFEFPPPQPTENMQRLRRKFVACTQFSSAEPLYHGLLGVVKRNLNDLGIAATNALGVWGGWVGEPPPGPDSPLLKEFAKSEKGLIIFDSLVEFHTGDEQSSTETRRFMKHFRALADLGASVLALHHTGKAESAQQYRGSSDIKAAVDTAFLLKKVSERDGRLHRLYLEQFKARLAPGRNFSLEFRQREGFMPCEIQPEERVVPQEIIAEVIAETPDITGTALTAAVRNRCDLPRNRIETILRTEAGRPDGRWRRTPGRGHTFHYRIHEVAENAA